MSEKAASPMDIAPCAKAPSAAEIEAALRPTTTAACPYCGLADHTGREHFQFVMSLSEGADDDDA